ncbi:hemerythrin domain-containing protein [Duganella violaceipulchra]|uniref:Hemerythrin domain-containing protein n=1 Tax=Duganella violaceipulchra TaxID=2849652 RepID=A0AA41H4J8_9BURK|nr:hemerythrin domain-containing protein [Duganella violaceicalia]MBV6321187.1 hemerythrin domain-containing protein [Duganella violaceicalia]MCP2009567.1 hemerythrin superfamily protein [Duganella violaceicalia]
MKSTTHSQDKIPKPIPTETDPQDAITLLAEDHEHVKSLFEQYEELGERAHATKQKLALQICAELTKHATAEEEIFYPAVRAASKADDIVDEALVEHASAKDLIAQIIAMESTDDMYDAKVKVLSELIDHHVNEEETEMFPKARKAKLDLDALGAEIAARKEQVELPPH